MHLGQRVIFADTRVDGDVRSLLRYAVRECLSETLLFDLIGVG
jgi:hypothetical protein